MLLALLSQQEPVDQAITAQQDRQQGDHQSMSVPQDISVWMVARRKSLVHLENTKIFSDR